MTRTGKGQLSKKPLYGRARASTGELSRADRVVTYYGVLIDLRYERVMCPL